MQKPYDNPFWDFNNGRNKRRAWLYCRKSVVIWRKSAVIFPEVSGYIFGHLHFCLQPRAPPRNNVVSIVLFK
jgi:hypothetical protein